MMFHRAVLQNVEYPELGDLVVLTGFDVQRTQKEDEIRSLPSYVLCTIGMPCFLAKASAFFGSRAATAAMITSGCDLAGVIKP
jgi:hypothetical protein